MRQNPKNKPQKDGSLVCPGLLETAGRLLALAGGWKKPGPAPDIKNAFWLFKAKEELNPEKEENNVM